MGSNRISTAAMPTYRTTAGIGACLQRRMPADSLLQQAADIINAGSKVTIFVGRGALGSREEVTQLATIVGGPVVKALLGKAVLPDRSPYTTGGIGLLGTAPSVDAMNDCDT